MERGIGMAIELAPKASITVPNGTRPQLTSYDSGYEHSLAHWLAVQQMVEAEEPEDAVRWSLARAS